MPGIVIACIVIIGIFWYAIFQNLPYTCPHCGQYIREWDKCPYCGWHL